MEQQQQQIVRTKNATEMNAFKSSQGYESSFRILPSKQYGVHTRTHAHEQQHIRTHSPQNANKLEQVTKM